MINNHYALTVALDVIPARASIRDEFSILFALACRFGVNVFELGERYQKARDRQSIDHFGQFSTTSSGAFLYEPPPAPLELFTTIERLDSLKKEDI